MKFSYDREEDILTIETAPEGTIDHAEQTGSLIAHFGQGGELFVLEILDASEFLSSLIVAALRDQEPVTPLATA
jgi:uncharacterized protein YuzE